MCATKRERTEGVQECNEGESCLKKAKAVMKIGCVRICENSELGPSNGMDEDRKSRKGLSCRVGEIWGVVARGQESCRPRPRSGESWGPCDTA